MLLAVAVDARGREHGIRAFSVHPGGIVGTGLTNHFSVETLQSHGVLDADGKPIFDPARDLKSMPQGAATQVWCATSPQLDGKGGVFCMDSDIAPMLPDSTDFSIAGHTQLDRVAGVETYALDLEAAERLWIVLRVLWHLLTAPVLPLATSQEWDDGRGRATVCFSTSTHRMGRRN